jgi:pullulanase
MGVRIKGWASAPSQSINCVSCHDNLTLWDKLSLSNPEDDRTDRIRMNKLAAAIILTSQGVPFIQAGEELLRSKDCDENSYKSPDSINAIKWDEKTANLDVYEYYKGLIAFRKQNPALRLKTADEIRQKLTFIDNNIKNLVAYRVEDIIVIFNSNKQSIGLNLPSGEWNIYVNGDKAGTAILGTLQGIATVTGLSAMLLKMK